LHSSLDSQTIAFEGQRFKPDRSLVVRDGATLVAHTGSTLRELSVPGGLVPAAHVEWIAVAPDRRRRGLLTRLMRCQLADARDRGEPLAVLWASEARIYQRFGYGMAVTRLTLDADTRDVRLRPVPLAEAAGRDSSLRCADPAAAEAELRSVYDAVRGERPGWSGRDDEWWRSQVLADPAGRRRGGTAAQAVIHLTEGTPDGYALWRVRQSWRDGSARGTVDVLEVVSASPAAFRALWGFLLSIDLTGRVYYAIAAPDEPLLHLADEPRKLGARFTDALWLRITDLPAALTTRRYAAPVDVVLDVTDGILPENQGRWRLTADETGSSCERTTAPADLECDIRDLGSAYLGEGTLQQLWELGHLTGNRPAALAALHRGLGWHRRPSAVESF
jgi:predicted acetyltransferase